MKNLIKIIGIVFVVLLAFASCVTTGATAGAAAGTASGAAAGGDEGSGTVAAAGADGSVMLIPGTSSAGWTPMFGTVNIRDGYLNFSPVRQGDRFRTDGRYRFQRRMDVSAFTQGYLQVEIMLSDPRMMDALEATMQLSSADFNYMKWRFNEIGSFEAGLSPQVPVEADVWTVMTFPLYKNSWSDRNIDNGLNFSRVDRFDFYLVGSPVEGTLRLRNIRVVHTP